MHSEKWERRKLAALKHASLFFHFSLHITGQASMRT